MLQKFSSTIDLFVSEKLPVVRRWNLIFSMQILCVLSCVIATPFWLYARDPHPNFITDVAAILRLLLWFPMAAISVARLDFLWKKFCSHSEPTIIFIFLCFQNVGFTFLT